MSVIFSATKASYNISGLAGLAIFNPGFSLMVKTHIMTEDIFFVILFRSKYFCIRAGDTKKEVFLITFITLILLMLNIKDIKKLFLVIISFTILTTEISFFSLFHILYKSRSQ